MNLEQAVKVAIKVMEAERQRHAVNANLYEQYGLNSGKAYAEYRQALLDAIDVLRRTVTP